jgi:hypothetical protein
MSHKHGFKERVTKNQDSKIRQKSEPLHENYCLAIHVKCKPVLWMHEILVRIRIRGSIPLTNGYGPSRRQQKLALSKLFSLLLFEGTYKSFFTDK